LLSAATTFDNLGAASFAKESEGHRPAVGVTRIARFLSYLAGVITWIGRCVSVRVSDWSFCRGIPSAAGYIISRRSRTMKQL
jgi:hypothetical protein